MTRPGRILIVDDEEPWRYALTSILQPEGFLTDAVATFAEALTRLNERLYHLLILDIRLVDTDATNVEGIELLRELTRLGLGKAVSVIILSAYGTLEYMHQAFKEHEVADFLTKDNFNAKALLDSVRQVFDRKVSINLALDIHWQKVKTPEEVVAHLEIQGARLKGKPALQGRIASELEDLLCRLFVPASRILVQPLVSGHSGSGVLLVRPFYDNGGARECVVKFGDVARIQNEFTNFTRYVQPFVGGGRNTTAQQIRRTPQLGGILYSFLGSGSHTLEDFGHYYQRCSAQEITATLDHLFLDTCSAWYANTGQLKPYNLTEDYQQMLGFSYQNLDRALSELQKYVQRGQMLAFNGLSSKRLFANPLPLVKAPPFIRPTYTCITHGDLNQHNLLVDGDRHTWLIDFQSTGPSHILRDVAQLDSEIRFVLLAPEDATLEERLLMEETLSNSERFSQVANLKDALPTDNPALSKAYSAVVHLRLLAYRLVAQNPVDDFSEYAIALFYNALNMLRFYGIPSAQRLHALLSASLLSNRLG